MKKTTTPTIGQQIRAARRKAGLTQRKLAAWLGVHHVTVCYWEKDARRPSLTHLLEVTRALKTAITIG